MGFAYFAKNGNTHHLIRLIPIELSLSQREYVLECMVHTGTSTQVFAIKLIIDKFNTRLFLSFLLTGESYSVLCSCL